MSSYSALSCSIQWCTNNAVIQYCAPGFITVYSQDGANIHTYSTLTVITSCMSDCTHQILIVGSVCVWWGNLYIHVAMETHHSYQLKTSKTLSSTKCNMQLGVFKQTNQRWWYQHGVFISFKLSVPLSNRLKKQKLTRVDKRLVLIASQLICCWW